MSVEDRDETVKAMVRRAVGSLSGLDWSNDYDLIAVMMNAFCDSGMGQAQLEAFAGDRRTALFGIFRERYHYAGVGKVERGFRGGYSCIMVQTTGVFAGIWFFALDGDYSLLTSHDGEAVVEFAGLEGVELVNAVIASALTVEIEPPAPRRSWLPRWLGGGR